MFAKQKMLLVSTLWILTACSSIAGNSIPVPTVPAAMTNERINDTIDHHFQQWARNDAIPPIYDPEFARAGKVDLHDDELVMGVSLGGEAKAYPVTTMQFREMVNDELAGIPILVTW